MGECDCCVLRMRMFGWLEFLFWLRKEPRLQAHPAPRPHTLPAGISPWRMWDNESFVPLPGCCWPRSAFPLEPSGLARCPSCLGLFEWCRAQGEGGLPALPDLLSRPLRPRAPVKAVRQPCPRHKTSFTLLHLAAKALSLRPKEVGCRKGSPEFSEEKT